MDFRTTTYKDNLVKQGFSDETATFIALSKHNNPLIQDMISMMRDENKALAEELMSWDNISDQHNVGLQQADTTPHENDKPVSVE
jgi:hypothetical protein